MTFLYILMHHNGKKYVICVANWEYMSVIFYKYYSPCIKLFQAELYAQCLDFLLIALGIIFYGIFFMFAYSRWPFYLHMGLSLMLLILAFLGGYVFLITQSSPWIKCILLLLMSYNSKLDELSHPTKSTALIPVYISPQAMSIQKFYQE